MGAAFLHVRPAIRSVTFFIQSLFIRNKIYTDIFHTVTFYTQQNLYGHFLYAHFLYGKNLYFHFLYSKNIYAVKNVYVHFLYGHFSYGRFLYSNFSYSNKIYIWPLFIHMVDFYTHLFHTATQFIWSLSILTYCTLYNNNMYPVVTARSS